MWIYSKIVDGIESKIARRRGCVEEPWSIETATSSLQQLYIWIIEAMPESTHQNKY